MMAGDGASISWRHCSRQAQPDAVVEDAPLSDQILALTEEQAKAVLLQLIQQQGLQAQVKAYLPIGKTKTARVAANDIRRHVTDAITSLRQLSRSQAYWHVGDVIGALRPYLDSAQQWLNDDEPQAALELMVALVDSYLETWTELDDSEGEVSGFVEEMTPIVVESILACELTSEERTALLARARQWDREASDYGVDSLEAVIPVLEDGFGCVLGIHAEIHSRLDETEKLVAEAWLRVLLHHQLSADYLAYALQTGYHAQYAAHLVTMGKIEEGIRFAHEHSLTPEDGVMVVNALARQDAIQQAVALGVEILRVSGHGAGLANRVAALAEQTGDRATAWDALFRAFSEYPTVKTYGRLKALSELQWQERAFLVWDVLRRTVLLSVATQMFLDEGMVDEAIAVCERSWVGTEVLLAVGEKAVHVQPKWVIERVTREALSIIQAGRSTYYRQAVALLTLVREAYRQQNDDAGWMALKMEVLAQHARKYTLVPLIQAL
jgi:hypothetical protein